MSVALRRVKLKSGKIQLVLDCYHKGQRKFEATGLFLGSDAKHNKEILKLAQAMRAKRELAFHSEAEGFGPSSKNKMNVFLFAQTVYENKKIVTQHTYMNALEHLKAFAGMELSFEKLTPKLCEQFKNYLLKILEVNSAARYFEAFKGILKKALKEKIILENPSIDISIRKMESLPKYLTEGDLNLLVKTPCGNETVRDAFFFSCFTGLRFEDVSRLKWKDVDKDRIERTQSKTGEGVAIPLNKQALNILKKRRAKNSLINDIIFLFPRRSTVDKVLKHWAKSAGLNISLSFHKARHTFATLAQSSGVDIYTISKLLGHRSLATTQIYAKVKYDVKRKAVDLLPEIEGL